MGHLLGIFLRVADLPPGRAPRKHRRLDEPKRRGLAGAGQNFREGRLKGNIRHNCDEWPAIS